MAASAVRDSLLEMGLDLADVNKAVRHFGAGLEAGQAVNWIFEGCPGYVEYAAPPSQPPPAAHLQHHQVVPYVGPQPQPPPLDSHSQQERHDAAARPQSSGPAHGSQYGQAHQHDTRGWDTAFRNVAAPSETDVASSMLAMKETNSGKTETGDSNRYRSDSIVTQPARDVWQPDPSDTGRPYGQIPPSHDDMDSAGMPVIDVSNPSGTHGISAPRGSPVAAASQPNNPATGLQTPQEEGDADLRRAIELSLQESTNQAGGASADMSRATSKTRAQQQEEDDFAAAMSQSILDADMQASATSIKELDPLDTRLRPEADVPIVITSPSSFLAYLPTIMHTFYYNPVFRKVILELEFNYLQPPTYDKYAGDAPVLTRALLPQDAPDCSVKLAALQRLFLFLSQSRRAKTGLVDIMDAFGIKVPTITKERNPLADMKALHDSIGQAWLQYITLWLEEQLKNGSITADQAAENSIEAKRVLFSQGLSLPDNPEAIVQTELEPAFFSEDNPAVQWTSYAAIQSVSPELNDTYSALDEYFGHTDRTAFILTPGKALYIYNHQAARTGPPTIGPAPAPYSTVSQSEENPTPFQVEPEIHLDRYDWRFRKEIMEMRNKVRTGQEQLQKLLLQREKLSTSAKNGKPLVAVSNLSDMDEAEIGESTADGKAILQQAIVKLEELSNTIEDPERHKSQLVLIQKLKAVVKLIQNQISKLNEEIDQIRREMSEAREFGRREMGPYELRTVVMWNGFMGRESMYAYVRSGTAKAEIDGSVMENAKWWKVASDGSFEVSRDDVLKDMTGVHMIGAGSIAQSYVLRLEDEEEEMVASAIPQPLVDAINADNDKYLADVEKLAGRANQATVPGPQDAMDLESAPTDSQATAVDSIDEAMHTDEKTALPSPAFENSEIVTTGQTLNLKGGASRRRMSMSSDTGSVASTSRLRLDDWDDDDDGGGETSKETVELGFPVKMKKGFKVVKDVGKIGGKPTWLDPALPLKPEMVTCEICKSRMEFLLQVNCPLDELPQAIYRTFYVYTCKKASCMKDGTSQGVKVYRVQLPAHNPYYELQEEEAQTRAQKFKDKQYASLCPTCKMKHDAPCPCKPWNEWLIETEIEELYEDEEEGPATTEEIEERIKNATLHKEELSAEDTNEPDTRTAVDAAFLTFQERLYNEPDQILRYYFRGDAHREPLWVSDQRKSRPKSVPRCACGAERRVEFQIMPPILSILGVDDLDKDSLDFGTLILYTCVDSCTISKVPPDSTFEGELSVFTPPSGWSEEVGYVQNFSEQGVRFRGV